MFYNINYRKESMLHIPFLMETCAKILPHFYTSTNSFSLIWGQCDHKKTPNVYKSCPKMISHEKWMTLTHLQKYPKNVRDLDKLIVSKGFKKLPKVQKIAQSGHTDWGLGRLCHSRNEKVKWNEYSNDVDYWYLPTISIALVIKSQTVRNCKFAQKLSLGNMF